MTLSTCFLQRREVKGLRQRRRLQRRRRRRRPPPGRAPRFVGSRRLAEMASPVAPRDLEKLKQMLAIRRGKMEAKAASGGRSSPPPLTEEQKARLAAISRQSIGQRDSSPSSQAGSSGAEGPALTPSQSTIEHLGLEHTPTSSLRSPFRVGAFQRQGQRMTWSGEFTMHP